MTTMTFTKKEPPEWLLAFWKEIDDKTFGKGFDCFTKDAIGNLGVADWHGREAIRENLRAFIDNPAALKPGCLMPAMGLSDPDLDAITAYMETLR